MGQDELLREARELAPALEELFHTIHQNPELGRREYRTAALIRRRLEAMGIEAVPMAGTGVMGVIRGGLPGKCLGFRADMDALPITEETGLPYASRTAAFSQGTAPAFGKAFTVAKADRLDYEVGDRVRHIKFGDGTVKEIKDGGKDYEVTVEFDTMGQKRMFASFAKLKKL